MGTKAIFSSLTSLRRLEFIGCEVGVLEEIDGFLQVMESVKTLRIHQCESTVVLLARISEFDYFPSLSRIKVSLVEDCEDEDVADNLIGMVRV